MKTKFGILCTVALSLCCFTTTATHGEELFNNADPFLDSGWFTASDTITNNIQADNFRLDESATITSVTFWGAWNFFVPTNDKFVIEIYRDLNGLPDENSLVATETIFDIDEVAVGGINGRGLYEFTTSLAPIQVEGDVNYWISIYEDLGTNTSQFFSWRNPFSGGASMAARKSDSSGYVWTTDPREHAFRLDGVAVPEPSGMPLLVFAATGCFARRSRIST